MWQYNPTKLNSSGIKTESLPFSAGLSTITRPADSLRGDRNRLFYRRTGCSRKFRRNVTTELDRTESFRPETPADDSPSQVSRNFSTCPSRAPIRDSIFRGFLRSHTLSMTNVRVAIVICERTVYFRKISTSKKQIVMLVAIYVDRKLRFWFSLEDLVNIDIS